MANNNLAFVKKDITYILQLNKQIQYHNKNDVKRAHDMAIEKQLFRTVLGQKYLVRLEQIINGTENSYACVLCGKDLDNSTLVCGRCQEKYKLMTPEQAAVARKAAQAQKIMAERKATESKQPSTKPGTNEVKETTSSPSADEDKGSSANLRKSKVKAANSGVDETRGAAAIFKEIEEKGLSRSEEKPVSGTDAAAATNETEENGLSVSEGTPEPSASASADSKLMDLFVNLFQEHTSEDAGEIFIAGTSKTTPHEYTQADVRPRPWLFLRIFVALMLTFGFLYICATQLQNLNTISGLLFLGAAAFPFSILVLMYETNTPKNISFFDVIKMFFAGSIAALLLTTITFNVFPIGQLNYSGAVIVGFIEELVKLFVIIIFIRLIDPKYILNGLLIGAAVGAGFSVFESAGYSFRFYLLNGGNIDYLTDIILLRAWSSLGSHTVWSAIVGGGLLSVKGDKPFSFKLFFNLEFLSDFIATLIIHSVWNCPFMDRGSNVYIKLVVLTLLAWAILLSLLKSGIRQFMRVCYSMHIDRKGAEA